VTYTRSEDSLGTIYKDLKISGDGITIKNGTVRGDVVITSNSKDVTLRNITIRGSLKLPASKRITLDDVIVEKETIIQ
jgi:uncharacterized Zn ribbon protein